MKLTIAGCSGSYAGSSGAASCYLLEHDGAAVVLDMGNGALDPLAQYRDIYSLDAVVLSHLHLDHIADVGGLYVARRYRPGGAPKQLPLYGPSDVAARIGRMYAPTDHEHDLGDSFDFTPFAPEPFVVGPFTITVAPATHPVDAFSIRVEADGQVLVFSGDTGPTDTLVELARDADLLLAEASFLEGPDNPPNLHLTAREAVNHGARAGVRNLVLTHLVPWNDINDTIAEAEQARSDFAFDGELLIARTGLSVTL